MTVVGLESGSISGGNEFLLCATTSGQIIWPFMKSIPGALSLGTKRQDPKANHSPPTSVDVESEWSFTSTLPTPSCCHVVVLSPRTPSTVLR
jgi:hypothetical protein